MSLDEVCREVKYIVNANANEQFFLWEKYAYDSKLFHYELKKYNWEQIKEGRYIKIGKINGRPTNICLSYARIDNQLVVFYEDISELVDWALIENWRWETFPNIPHTNAQNFHNVLNYIDGQ